MRTVSRAKDQSIAIGHDALLAVFGIDGRRARVGLRCPAHWRVEQVELVGLKLGRGGSESSAPAEVERRTRFFELPANGVLKIGPSIRLRLAELTTRVATFEIDGIADDEIEAV